MEIKEIKQAESRTGSGYYSLTLSDGRVLRADAELVANERLYVGLDLSEQELDALIDKCEFARVRRRALRIIGGRKISRRELIKRLRDKGEESDLSEGVTDHLENIGVINDEDYSSSIVRHYMSKGYGIEKIKSELYRRGIPVELLEDAIEEYEVAEDVVDKLVHKRLRGELPNYDELRKTKEYLRRRGFTWDEIGDAIARYCEEIDE